MDQPYKMNPAGQKADICLGFSFGDLLPARHAFATVARALGIPLDIISSILGHTDLKTTAIYSKYDDRERIEEIGKWNN